MFLIGFTACKSNFAKFTDLKSGVGESLWNSVIQRVATENPDTAAVDVPKPFNFFLREGIASKFGF